MPELPEVETIRAGLAPHLAGRQIVEVLGQGGRLVRDNPQGIEDLRQFLPGKTVRDLQRRGKYMWIRFEGETRCLQIHLGMSGQVRWNSAPAAAVGPLERHEHVRLRLDDDSLVRFFDQRMFGSLTICDLVPGPAGRVVSAGCTHIAADPLEPGFDLAQTVRNMRRSVRHVKTVLLDQQIVSGLGNIYSDEALHELQIHGNRRANTLTSKQLQGLLQAGAVVMRRSIAAGGTSFDELYVNASGEPGYFTRSLTVYGRAGQACARCQQAGRESLIERTVVDGRSHFYCPVCQRPPV